MFRWFLKIFKSDNKYVRNLVAAINAIEPEIKEFSNERLLEDSQSLRRLIQDKKMNLEEALPRAFALVRESAKRTLNQRHFDVQLMAGIALHQGRIAEMRTGEGKTLAATAPAYLNALIGKGAHVVTVNEYLAKRDAVWMGQIYHALGLRVSCLIHEGALAYDPSYIKQSADDLIDKERDITGSFLVQEEFLRPISRREAYLADITYGTNHEFGFDYLRDNLVHRLEDQVQGGRRYFAIVDEVDSILIDEARTPLIIPAPDTESSQFYKVFARVAQNLEPDADYLVDEKLKTADITQGGIDKVEQQLRIKDLFSAENLRLTHYLQESLRAKALFLKDRDYVVKNGEVVIVDQFTGRMMLGRRYSGGLHQAIEAKEGLTVNQESRTYAQISIQNYFRLYEKLSGMTGTAQTSAEEFDKAGQPVLVGTISIEKNEYLSKILKQEGVPHEMLNAKNHEREGSIIAQAGKPGAVTVATNMAGRGVDIILGGNPPEILESQKIKDLGGLFVIGTERHDSRRIDNQLRGRAGRQGDPGSSQFFLSLEDDLMRIFGGDKLKSMMQWLKVPDDMPIASKSVSRAISQAQSKVEGMNFDARKHLLEYDDVLNKQRLAIYFKRQDILENGVVARIPKSEGEALLAGRQEINISCDENSPRNNEPLSHGIARQILGMLDLLWMNHLENMEALRESVRLRADGQHDPLVEYRREGHLLFQQLLADFDKWLKQSAEGGLFARPDLKDKSGLGMEENRENLQTMTNNNDNNKIPNPDVISHSSSVIINNKVGRNDPCPCGSGKKYKRCHGK